MPHQKSTVLSVCFIYRRSAYLEAIVIRHCRLFTYFSGIVPSHRIRKWVNWYADCLSLKPFQNQLCRWFSTGACIPFLNVMRCSGMGAVRWLCQTPVGQVLVFILAELPLNSREIFPRARPASWSPPLTLPSLCEPGGLHVAVTVPVPFPPLLLYSLDCFLPRCPNTFI